MLKNKICKTISCLLPIKSWRKKLRKYGALEISKPQIDIAPQNEIILTNKYANLKNLKIIIKGSGNKIFIDTDNINIITGLNICIDGSDNEIKILSGNKIDKMTFMINSNNCSLSVGKDCFFGGITINADLTAQGRKLFIGDESIISTGVYLALGDEHPIYDLATKKPVNNSPNKNIEISERVWICRNCIILKDTKISHDSIIGAASVVKGHFDESNIILAGNPAKTVKHGIYWKKNFECSSIK